MWILRYTYYIRYIIRRAFFPVIKLSGTGMLVGTLRVTLRPKTIYHKHWTLSTPLVADHARTPTPAIATDTSVCMRAHSYLFVYAPVCMFISLYYLLLCRDTLTLWYHQFDSYAMRIISLCFNRNCLCRIFGLIFVYFRLCFIFILFSL